MKKNITLTVSLLCCSCASQFELENGSLSTANSIPVVEAVVSNPYPECNFSKESDRRLASLQGPIEKRVYLVEGGLCRHQ